MTIMTTPPAAQRYRRLSCSVVETYTRWLAEHQSLAVAEAHLAGRCLAAAELVPAMVPHARCPRCGRQAPEAAQLAAQRQALGAAKQRWLTASAQLALYELTLCSEAQVVMEAAEPALRIVGDGELPATPAIADAPAAAGGDSGEIAPAP